VLAARIASILVAAGQHVSQGEILIKLEAPDVTHEQNVAQSRLDAVLLRLARQSADREDRSSKQVFEGERAALEMQLAGLKKQSGELEIKAPATGVVVEFNPALHERQWIGAKDQIALIDSSDAVKAVGYVSEDNLWRLERGAAGRFIADVPQGAAVDVTLSEVAATGAASIEIPELSSLNGGRIETHADARQKLIPATAQYLVTMHASTGTAPPRSTVRGTVQIEARAESLFTGFYRRVLKILVRESGI
jgi:putative peptide zinc metalloprotease protein